MSFDSQGPPGLRILIRPAADFWTGRGPGRLTGAVIHYTAGNYPGATDWLTRLDDSYVSAHYCVSRGVEVSQLVRLENRAFHAGRSWGKWNPNNWSVGYEFAATQADGYTFTRNQYEFAARHLGWLFGTQGLRFAYPDGDPVGYRPKEYWSHIFADSGGWCCGHSAVNPNKPDPGPNFDWNWLERRVKFYLAEIKKTRG